ncbi:MAG: undecaprenyl-phosphate galactose phosphotransferase WbaP [Alphaproteobacteria bacterium]|nr:undecaprenyl-phosphate galactose phosphotransferase WbaP [Alphaproteobacteria bacterium]MDE2336848.1 undecaprenyl-phosphate galactose phosphotransferase WbaP [Alphaproteobacteria bacterium]
MSHRSKFTAASLLLADSIASLLAFTLAAFCASAISTAMPLSGFFFLSAPFILACMVFFAAQGHYNLRTPWWTQAGHILLASTACFVLSALVAAARRMPAPVAPEALLWLFMPPCLMLARWRARALLMRRGLWAIPAALAGNYEVVLRLVRALQAETYLAYDIRQAFLPDATAAQIEDFKKLCPAARICPTLAPLLDANSHVFFCPDGGSTAHAEILAQLEKNRTRFSYVPPAEGYFLYNAAPRRFFGHGIVALESRELPLAGSSLLLKCFLDRVCAAVALALLSPVFIIIARAIKKDGGPAMYGHGRIGKDGKPFTCLKFRSMAVNAREMLDELLKSNPTLRKEYEETYKLKDDPRVTKIGKFLRKTSLDELPQLLNVLQGHMSLTGPRPIVEDEKKYYAEKIREYLSVRPGLTGLWQVSGRSDTGYKQRVYLDGWYVRNWSLWNDLIIFFKTVTVVLKRKGAY